MLQYAREFSLPLSLHTTPLRSLYSSNQLADLEWGEDEEVKGGGRLFGVMGCRVAVGLRAILNVECSWFGAGKMDSLE